MSHGMPTFRTLVPVLAAIVALPQIAAAAPLSVEAFNQLLADRSVATGVRYTVEGRFSSLSGTLLKMSGCDVAFRAVEGFEFKRPAGDSRTIEISGSFVEDNGKRTFLVSSLTPLQSDTDRFRGKLSQIDAKKPDEWYGLADWAWRRGEFYKDDELFALARDARKTGLSIERTALAVDDADGLFRIANKARELKLAETYRAELLHEACRILWSNSQRTGTPTSAVALKRSAETLPGAEEPLKAELPEVDADYRKDPLATYAAANAETRLVLHRLFHREIVLAIILAGAKDDGSNGAAIADALDAQAPERHALAEQFRDRALDYRLSQVGLSTRSEMLQLKADFEKRKRDKEARQTVTGWLARLTEQRRREGPAGLMKAADEYLALLDDRESAYQLMLEAWTSSSQADDVRKRFEELGYVLRDGRWLSRADVGNVPLPAVEQAVLDGRVIAGMSTAQVRRMLGAPTTVSRVASSVEIVELWIYGERNRSRLALRVTRRPHRADGEVLDVKQLAPR